MTILLVVMANSLLKCERIQRNMRIVVQ